MGTGASSSLRGRHSDSRISSIRLDGDGAIVDVLAPTDSSRTTGNNTVTLRFNLDDGACRDAWKPRARSLSGSNPTGVAEAAVAAAGAVASESHALHALDEGREDHNSSASSIAAESHNSNLAAAAVEQDLMMEQLDAADPHNAYDDDAFEEDTIEWKKGEALGSGSYGTVYLARDERSGALMAVKEIIVADENEDDVRNASREVALLRSLHHDNIVKYLGSQVDVAARTLHIFTEWVPGGNLEQNRKRFGGSERVVKRFTRQILLGVAYLHSKHIIHHDIKPTNLLVDQHGVVKLADFGSSRLISTTTLVNNESMRGTPNYMAPEVIKQSGPRSYKSDMWSVGCSVLRLLTGRALWGDKHFDSQIALLYFIAHLEKLPPLPDELSYDAKSFISLCLEVEPSKRPTAEELLSHPFVDGSRAFSGCGSGTTAPPLPSYPAVRLASRSTLVPLPPLKQVPHGDETGAGSPQARRLPATAPAMSPSASASASTASASGSRSQLVTSRFPSRGLFDTNDDGPENAPMRSKTASHTSQRRHHPPLRGDAPSSSLVVGSVDHEDDEDQEDEIYSYSEFSETVHAHSHSNSHNNSHSHSLLHGGPAVSKPAHASTNWDDQPIRTDAALADKERQLLKLADEKRVKEERERKYQEELVEFRRQLLQQPR